MSESKPLNTCGCCDPDRDQPAHYNPPGQPALSYRIGTHSSILGRMVSRLPRWRIPDGYHANRQPLNKLTTRAGDDPAVALLDAWAVVVDVLSFYQERIANENYLRTATERRSVLELARAIGYELSPGVAAETYLAFTVDEADSSPSTAVVAAGTQVLSIPEAEGELPQTFETSAEFVAQKLWNTLRPRLTEPQIVTMATNQLRLQGSALDLEIGDLLLFVEEATKKTAVKRITDVKSITADEVTVVTLVDLALNPPDAPVGGEEETLAAFTLPSLTGETKPALTETAVTDLFAGVSASESQLQATLKMYEWQASELLTFLHQQVMSSPDDIKVYALREKSGIFGHNAPHYSTLPPDNEYSNLAGQFHDWDKAGWQIWHDSIIADTDSGPSKLTGQIDVKAMAIGEQPLYEKEDSLVKYYQDADLYLERPVEGIVPGSWLVLTQPQVDPQVLKIRSAEEASIAGFSLSAKTTALELNDLNDNDIGNTYKSNNNQFMVRKTTAYVKSEALTLAVTPLSTILETSAELKLSGMVIGLQKGQAVVVSGERSELPGVSHSEVKLLSEITHDDLHTVLHFTANLAYPYLRETVRINANVVRANHGETVAAEVLGSGDGSSKNQRFTLKKPPLTHISAPSGSGAAAELTVRVNGVAWQQASSLYGLDGNSKSYLVRIDNEAKATIIFGDGQQGARLPTGSENVVAAYRSGIGLAGEVGAGSLTLLKTRPLGIRGVTNPLAASGAADPESLADARDNAPLTVLTLDRIVSLRDYEDYARAYAGIGKAQATALWNGERQLVHITIADTNGDTIQDTDTLFINLLDSINAARDPLHEVQLGSFVPRSFNVGANVLIDPAYLWVDVKQELEKALLDAFAFKKRTFGQSVTAAEIVALCHTVGGVTAVDLNSLYIENVDETRSNGVSLTSILPAQTVQWDEDHQSVEPAQLLLINPYGLNLSEMTV